MHVEKVDVYPCSPLVDYNADGEDEGGMKLWRKEKMETALKCSLCKHSSMQVSF